MEIQPRIENTITSHDNDVYSVCFSPDQSLLCSTGYDEEVILTNLSDYQTRKVLSDVHGSSVYGSDFSPSGLYLCTGAADKLVVIWNVESGSFVKLKGHQSWVFGVRFFRNDQAKIVSCAQKTIKIWDIELKKEILSLPSGKGGTTYNVDIHHDDNTILTGHEDDFVKIWDFRSGKCVKVLEYHKDSVFSVQFHPTDTFSFGSGSADKTIKISDIRTFKLLQSIEEHDDSVNSICFHPSGKLLLSGSRDETIQIFHLLLEHKKETSLYTLKHGHSDAVTYVEFSPDGEYFASSCEGNKVIVWNFPLGRNITRENNDEFERVEFLIQHLEELEDERNDILKIEIVDLNLITLNCYKFLF